MRRLALSNSYSVELGIFKDVLSDLAIALPDNKTSSSQEFSGVLFNSLPTGALTVARFQNFDKKKAKSRTISGRLSIVKRFRNTLPKPSTSSLVIMELIRLDKQTVQVSANIVESTLPKHIRELTG